MAAGLGFKDFTTGEVLTAADVDGYLMQGVWVFASAAARDAAVTSPQEGNFAYLKDTNVTTYYTGSAWANLDTTGMTNPMTTTGDMIYSSSGSTPARLALGTANQQLRVNAGATAPEWFTPAASGSMTLLSTTSMNTGTSTVTVSSISQDYKTLEIQILNPTWATGTAQLWLNIESSSSIQGAGSAMWNSGVDSGVSPTSGVNFNFTATGNSNTDAKVTGLVRIFNYASSSAYKPVMFISGDNTRASFQGGVVATNTAVDQITINNQFSYNFNGGSILVYGIN